MVNSMNNSVSMSLFVIEASVVLSSDELKLVVPLIVVALSLA
jgi:hypothetical protein